MSQSDRLKATCTVTVDGFDVTNKLLPFLVSITIVDEAHAECHLELDDRQARLPIPPLLAPVTAELGWNNENHRVFEGVILDLEYGFDRKQGGRRMFIHADGANWLGKVKEPFSKHWGDDSQDGPKIPLKQILEESAKHAGARLKYISPQFNNVGWKYKAQQNESFVQFAEGLAKELGGAIFVLKEGNQAQFRHPMDAQGQAEVIWGDNLIEMRVRPFVARTAWGGGNQSYYDPKEGSWQTFAKKFGGMSEQPWAAASANQSPAGPAANKDEAEQQVGGMEDEQYPGDGHIVINGEPGIEAYQFISVQGVRPGIDGQYFVLRVEHKWSRQGFTTALEVHPDRHAPAGSSIADFSGTQPTWTLSDVQSQITGGDLPNPSNEPNVASGV